MYLTKSKFKIGMPRVELRHKNIHINQLNRKIYYIASGRQTDK